jgi:hypothetical protein
VRKAENLSYGRLIIFSRETLHDFLKLLTQTMGAKRPAELHLVSNGFTSRYGSTAIPSFIIYNFKTPDDDLIGLNM